MRVARHRAEPRSRWSWPLTLSVCAYSQIRKCLLIFFGELIAFCSPNKPLMVNRLANQRLIDIIGIALATFNDQKNFEHVPLEIHQKKPKPSAKTQADGGTASEISLQHRRKWLSGSFARSEAE